MSAHDFHTWKKRLTSTDARCSRGSESLSSFVHQLSALAVASDYDLGGWALSDGLYGR